MTADTLGRRPFGQTGLQVPPIAIGCAPLGSMPETFGYAVPEEPAIATVLAALESPIPYLDTAATYGDGESERRVGQALRQVGGLPSGAMLQTKEGLDPTTSEYSGETVKRRMTRSLELLGVDYVPVVYLHDPERTTYEATFAPGGPIEVLQSFKEQGVIRHLGVAGGPIDLEIRYVESGVFDAVITHNRYTLVNATAEPLLEIAAQRGLAVLNAAPYGSGMLAKGPDAYPRYAYQEAAQAMVERVRALAAVCERYGVPLAAAALQFSLRDPRISTTIVGMSSPERVQETIDLATMEIPADCWAEIDALPRFGDNPEEHRFAR